MSWLSTAVRAWKVKSVIKTAIHQAQEVLREIPDAEVTRAKAVIALRIQAQHRVPGEVRRWAVALVDSIHVDDVNNFLETLEDLL